MVSVKAAATGSVSWGPIVRGLGPLEHADTERLSSLPSVGVEAALREVTEDIEDVLSALARGANGGGLQEWMGGLNGRAGSARFGFPGGNFGRDDGLGGRGGMGLPADRGVPARAGDDGPLPGPGEPITLL